MIHKEDNFGISDLDLTGPAFTVSAQMEEVKEGPPSEEVNDSEGGGIPESEVVPSDGSVGLLPWGDVQEAIMDSWIQDSQEWGGAAMVALSKRLRTQIDEFTVIRGATGDEVWELHRLQKLLEIERVRMGGFNWDRVEQAALAKMAHLVDTGQVRKLGELLAIASTANRATRRGPTGQPTESGDRGMGGNNVQVNIYGQPTGLETPELPGAGSLGSIQLNLSARTVKQLSEERVIDGDYKRMSDRVEMLEAKDIKELTGLAEKHDEE